MEEGFGLDDNWPRWSQCGRLILLQRPPSLLQQPLWRRPPLWPPCADAPDQMKPLCLLCRSIQSGISLLLPLRPGMKQGSICIAVVSRISSCCSHPPINCNQKKITICVHKPQCIHTNQYSITTPPRWPRRRRQPHVAWWQQRPAYSAVDIRITKTTIM